jgi:RNA polymerase sigma-70 factor (ECF subfamily)
MAEQKQIDNWISAAKAGNQAGFEGLYQHFVVPLYRLVNGMLLHELDAEEVVQDSFSYAFRQIDRYDSDRSSFKTWLYTIAVSRCRNKRRRKWLPIVRLADIRERLAGSAPHPETVAMRQHARQSIREALQELSPRLREAVVLRYFEGMTYREMGEVLGCPQKTAESRIRLAHERLLSLLADQREALLEELPGYET